MTTYGLKKKGKYVNQGGGISPRKNFGKQISSPGIPSKFSGPFYENRSNFSGAKFVRPKIFGVFGATSFISYVFPYGPREKPTNFFQREICPLRNYKLQNSWYRCLVLEDDVLWSLAILPLGHVQRTAVRQNGDDGESTSPTEDSELERLRAENAALKAQCQETAGCALKGYPSPLPLPPY